MKPCGNNITLWKYNLTLQKYNVTLQKYNVTLRKYILTLQNYILTSSRWINLAEIKKYFAQKNIWNDVPCGLQ